MKKKLKYIKPEIVFIVFEICDVLENSASGTGHNSGTGDGNWEGTAKQEDFIFDTSEDFDSPYHLFDE